MKKTILVSGATGVVGERIVRSLLRNRDVTVIATSRDPERLENLQQRLELDLRPMLVPLLGDAGDFAAVSDIADRVTELGGIDCAIAIFGRGTWTGGPLLDLDPSDWRSVLDEMLTAHFAFARAIVPLLSMRPGSLFLSIGGGAAFGPVSDAGLMSIAAAGQLMLTRVLNREIGSGDPRVVELVVNGPVIADEPPGPGGILSEDVGRVVSAFVLTGTIDWKNVTTNGPAIVMNPGG